MSISWAQQHDIEVGQNYPVTWTYRYLGTHVLHIIDKGFPTATIAYDAAHSVVTTVNTPTYTPSTVMWDGVLHNSLRIEVNAASVSGQNDRIRIAVTTTGSSLPLRYAVSVCEFINETSDTGWITTSSQDVYPTGALTVGTAPSWNEVLMSGNNLRAKWTGFAGGYDPYLSLAYNDPVPSYYTQTINSGSLPPGITQKPYGSSGTYHGSSFIIVRYEGAPTVAGTYNANVTYNVFFAIYLSNSDVSSGVYPNVTSTTEPLGFFRIEHTMDLSFEVLASSQTVVIDSPADGFVGASPINLLSSIV